MFLEISILIKLIPNFDTTYPQQIYKFIRSCESAFKLADPGCHQILLVYALNSIIGTSAPDIHCKQYATWEDLKSYLIEKFSNIKTISHLNLELQSIFQKPGESITDYFHRIDLCRSKIIEKLNAEIKDGTLLGRMATTEETALSVFVNGLCNEIGTMLRTRGFQNLSEASRFAMEEEKIRAMNSARLSLFSPNRSKPANNTKHCTQPTDIRNTYTTPIPKTCSYCKNLGHLITECRKRAFNNSLRYNQLRQPTQQTSLDPRTSAHPPMQRTLPALPSRMNHLNSKATDELSNSSEIATASCSKTLTPTWISNPQPQW